MEIKDLDFSAAKSADAAASPADPFTLTAQQASALALLTAYATGAHGARMMTLEGYAGTGKTTLVARLIDSLEYRMSIAIAAPTNKAVGVLREKIGAQGELSLVAFGSIHSFMGLRLKERDDGRHECVPEGSSSIHQYQLVIIDECSMLSKALFANLVAQLRGTDTRVLFVGDPAQLPPVGDNEQASPTFTHVSHKATLTDIVRQVADHPIIATSMRIRQSIEQNVRMTPSMIEASLPAPPSDALFTQGGYATAYNWALHDVLAGHDTRVLAFTNQTVQRYNREIHGAIHGHATPFAVGETVMFNTAYDARLETPHENLLRGLRVSMFNSEECTVTAIERVRHPNHDDIDAWLLRLTREDGTRVLAWIPVDPSTLNARVSEKFSKAAALKMHLAGRYDSTLDGERKQLIAAAWGLKNDFADARHIYAMTVHKSQGSTLHTAIVDLSDLWKIRDDFDYNRALYVATTRAAKHLAFVA